MAKITIAHSDQNVRKALIQTLKNIMPEAEFDVETGSEGMIFAAEDTPRRLKTLIAAMTHKAARAKRPSRLILGSDRLEVHAREFFTSGKSVMLTEKEVDLLLYLFQRAAPASREDLLKDVWQYAADVDTHTIETHIYRLRQKIEPDAENPSILITTKEGYQLAATASSKA